MRTPAVALLLALSAMPAVALLLAMPADAVSPAPACRIEGWSADPDPAGLRVRAEPSLKARQVGRLPAFVRDDDGDYGPAFTIDGARDGWLHIRDARDAWAPPGRTRPTYRGAGWVHGSRVRFAVQSAKGRSGAAAGSPVVVDTGGEWLTDVGEVAGVLDCAGGSARVSYRIGAGKPVRGPRAGVAWFDRICGDQRTTCGS